MISHAAPRNFALGENAISVARLAALSDLTRLTLYMQRVRYFIRAEGVLRMTRVVVLVASLHVPQCQRIVRPHVGSAKLKAMNRIVLHLLACHARSTLLTYFCCNFMSARRHSTLGLGSPTTWQAMLTSTRHGTTIGTPNDIMAAGTN